MTLAGFEPTIPASEWPSTHALGCPANGIGIQCKHTSVINVKSQYRQTKQLLRTAIPPDEIFFLWWRKCGNETLHRVRAAENAEIIHHMCQSTNQLAFQQLICSRSREFSVLYGIRRLIDVLTKAHHKLDKSSQLSPYDATYLYPGLPNYLLSAAFLTTIYVQFSYIPYKLHASPISSLDSYNYTILLLSL
jgi:hypothetical protein